MLNKSYLRRYFIFLVGLVFNGFGVSLITKASLGTSPISSIPYVLSLSFKPTIGEFTIIFSCLLILLQIILLQKKFPLQSLLQFPVSILFGEFIDAGMYILSAFHPDDMLICLLSLLLGCLVLGFGVYLEVIADVVMLPGEAFVKAVNIKFHTEFGSTKMCFDTTMSVIAGLLSFIFTHKLQGVGAGTIIAALLVGYVARQIAKIESLKSVLLNESCLNEIV